MTPVPNSPLPVFHGRQSIQSIAGGRGIDGLRHGDDMELIGVELMSIRGPRAKTLGVDENPAKASHYEW